MNIFERIHDLNYVVQRGWHNLGGEGDIDLFVSDADYETLKEITSGFFTKVDIRRPSDNYYPPYIGDILLLNRRDIGGLWVPSKEAYFLSLFYHAYVQGRKEKYQVELKKAFLDWIPPVEPEDKGVIYNPDD